MWKLSRPLPENETAHPFRVRGARHLHHDLVVAALTDLRLGHAELVDAVVEHLQGAPQRAILLHGAERCAGLLAEAGQVGFDHHVHAAAQIEAELNAARAQVLQRQQLGTVMVLHGHEGLAFRSGTPGPRSPRPSCAARRAVPRAAARAPPGSGSRDRRAPDRRGRCAPVRSAGSDPRRHAAAQARGSARGRRWPRGAGRRSGSGTSARSGSGTTPLPATNARMRISLRRLVMGRYTKRARQRVLRLLLVLRGRPRLAPGAAR